MKKNMVYISAYFCLVQVIKKLETSNLSIVESLAIVENASDKLSSRRIRINNKNKLN